MGGCAQESSTPTPTCTLDLAVESPEVYPGQSLTLSGGPLTAVYDTRAQVGGLNAIVQDISRTECAACDACREEAECTGCFACTECEASCDTCTEALAIEVPALPAGPADLVVLNAYGSSSPLQLQVLDTDTGTPDSGFFDLGDSGDSGDTASTSGTEQRSADSPYADLPAGLENKNTQNLPGDTQDENTTFWTFLSRVVDRMRLVMY